MKVSEIVIIQQNYQAGKYDIKQHSDDRTRTVKSLLGRLKYRFGLGKTVSTHLKISEFSLVKIFKILFSLKLTLVC